MEGQGRWWAAGRDSCVGGWCGVSALLHLCGSFRTVTCPSGRCVLMRVFVSPVCAGGALHSSFVSWRLRWWHWQQGGHTGVWVCVCEGGASVCMQLDVYPVCFSVGQSHTGQAHAVHHRAVAACRRQAVIPHVPLLLLLPPLDPTLPTRDTLKQLMIKKEIVGDLLNHLRLARQRALAAERTGSNGSSGSSGQDEGSSDWAAGRAAAVAGGSIDASSFGPEDEEALNETLGELLLVLEQLDERIGPMLEQDGSHFNKRCARTGGWSLGWGGWVQGAGWGGGNIARQAASKHLLSSSLRSS